MAMTEEKFFEQLEYILDAESELTMDTVLKDLEEWDSLSVVSVIAMASANCGKKLTAEQVHGAETVADLYALLQ